MQSGALGDQTYKVTANPNLSTSQSLIRDSEGTVPAMSLLRVGHDGPLSTSSGGLWKDCAGASGLPGGQLITELGSTIPHRLRVPVTTSCWGRDAPL